ncbi:MAG: hypothetical protein ABIW82_02675 [Dokdonella sp.]
MPLLVFLLFAFAASAKASNGSGDPSDYRLWLTAQIQVPRHADTAASSILAVVWQHQQCARDAACHVRVVESEAAKLAHAKAAGDPALLALLAGAEDPTLDSSRRANRWRELAKMDVRNSYPSLVLAGIRWQRDERTLALSSLRQSIARPRFDDYYSTMFFSVKQSFDGHPPGLTELAPCALAGEAAPASIDETGRSLAAINDLLGSIGFTQLTSILAMCKTTTDPIDRERRALCDSIGAKMDAQATTSLSQNIGLALRRFSTGDADLQARYTQQQHDNLDDLQGSLWWIESAQSAVRREATALWLGEFARAGELAGAAMLRKQYGDSPEPRAKREANWRKRLAEGQACYAKRIKTEESLSKESSSRTAAGAHP